MEAVINKYQGGKIYTIRSPHTDKYYIGSTIEKYLSSRLNGHNQGYKVFLNGTGGRTTSSEIIKLGDAYIELLEFFPCNSKLELHKREGELIRLHKDNCVNKLIAGRSLKEWVEDNEEHLADYQKEYRNQNKESIAKTKKRYEILNKESIAENHKEYYNNNKDVIIKRTAQYYHKNKETIKAKKLIYQQLNKDKIKAYQIQYRLKRKLGTIPIVVHISN